MSATPGILFTLICAIYFHRKLQLDFIEEIEALLI